MIGMMNEQDEQLKAQVREYWNSHPCGTQFTDVEWGSKEFFDEVERFRYDTQPFMERIVGFKKFAGKTLLEVGCGLGTDLLEFAKGGAIVTGVDLTPQSIELVKKRFALADIPVDARVSDAEHLPFGDNSFDVVYSFGVLHHTPNTQQAIDEVYRVLKPGGKIVIMLYHKNSLHVWLGIPLYLLWKFLQTKGSKLPAQLFLRIGSGCMTAEKIRWERPTRNPKRKECSVDSKAGRMFSVIHTGGGSQNSLMQSIKQSWPRGAGSGW